MSDLHWALQREQPPEKSEDEDSDKSLPLKISTGFYQKLQVEN